MGLRCLLGHDFGEAELKRDREEQGEEVVVTVSEQKTCTRCGATKIVSENTEVTSIQQLTETADDEAAPTPTADDAAAGTAQPADGTASGTTADDATASSATASEGSEDTSKPTADEPPAATDADDGITITDDAELLSDDEPTAAGEEAPEDETTTTDAEPTDTTAEEPSAAASEEPDDDGVILSDTSDSDTGAETVDADTATATGTEPAAESSDDRATGEWPEYEGDSQPGEEPTAWPEQQGDDDGFDAAAPSEDGPDDVTFNSGGGFTPEVDGDADRPTDDEDEVIEEPEELTKAGEASVYEPTVDDIDTEFYCPECGFSRPSGASSMRAGDICPECRRGYIAERRR